MKNLMIYINPQREFTEDYSELVKIQIDNSIRSWKIKDILLVTNFPYSYGGIDAKIVPDDLFCEHRKRASKINVICHMLENNMIDDLCWFHDFDAYQIEELPEDVLGNKDAAFTDYGFNSSWNTGSFFFIPKAKDLFELIRKLMNKRRINEEQALNRLTAENVDNINERYIRLNNTYNFGQKWHSDISFSKAEKPIKVFHFHPKAEDVYERFKPLMPEYLMEIFKKHGY